MEELVSALTTLNVSDKHVIVIDDSDDDSSDRDKDVKVNKSYVALREMQEVDDIVVNDFSLKLTVASDYSHIDPLIVSSIISGKMKKSINLKKNKILLPICFQSHWTLLSVDFDSHIATFWDSQRPNVDCADLWLSQRRKDIILPLVQFLSGLDEAQIHVHFDQLKIENSLNTDFIVNIPNDYFVQKDGDECGLFVCAVMQALCDNLDVVKHVSKHLETKSSQKEYCQFIYEQLTSPLS